ncbi:MAG: hypothetical protein LC739_10785 [Actinobacteria bacterium]|nr:hypothetical protein [Actinomycetota bacterium]
MTVRPAGLMLERPTSRRRWRWWAVGLTFVILAALALARINAQASAAVNYLDGMRRSAEGLVTASSTFSGLDQNVVDLDRIEFETATTAVLEALAEGSEAVDEPPETSSLIGAASLLRLALATWESGVATFREGLLGLADQAESGEEQIYAGLQLVSAGDEIYAEVLKELDREDVPDPITSMPVLSFQSSTRTPVAAARIFASAASADNSLFVLRADLAVSQVSSQPVWVTDPDGDLVIAAVESIVIDVVVANLGNTQAPAQMLFLNMAPAEGEEIAQTIEVPPLEAGGETTVSFPALAVAPGFSYNLSVALQLISPDGNADNDGVAVSFFVNEPTG